MCERAVDEGVGHGEVAEGAEVAAQSHSARHDDGGVDGEGELEEEGDEGGAHVLAGASTNQMPLKKVPSTRKSLEWGESL